MRILRHLLPDCRLVAVDIDSEIVALAELNMRLGELGIEVHFGDAYAWVSECREKFDVVIDDVYLAGRTDVFRPGKSDQQQISALKRLVAPGGRLGRAGDQQLDARVRALVDHGLGPAAAVPDLRAGHRGRPARARL